MRIVDAHAHIWSVDSPWMGWLAADELFKPIARDFPPAELVQQLGENGVDAVLLVQAGADTEETRQYLAVADRERKVAGVVGWVSLSSAEATRRDLERLGPSERLVGIRHNDGWQPDGHVLIEGKAIESARVLAERGLVLDVHLFSWAQLAAVADFIAAVPELTVVVNHLGKPSLQDRASYDPWAAATEKIAAYPNAVVKYSGWSTRLSRPNPEQLRPYARHLLNTFGPERLLFGSNWPVAGISGRYAEVLQASQAAVADLDPASQAAIFGANAARVYGLPA